MWDMEPTLLLMAAGILVTAGIIRFAGDTYGERHVGTLLIFGLSLVCVALGLREMAF